MSTAFMLVSLTDGTSIMAVADTSETTSRMRSAGPTKRAIRLAAARLFAERGFSDTSVRDIAGSAGVNQALVIRYFGSKEALFIETVSDADRFDGLVDPPLETLGRAIVERLVRDRGDAAWRMYTALMRAVDRPDVRAHILKATTTQIVEPLAMRLAGNDSRVRAHLVAAQIIGLLNELWIIEDSELTSVSPDVIVDIYGRSIQAIIDR